MQAATRAVMFNQGQVCCAGTRTFVHEDIYDEFVKKTVAQAQKWKVGDPFSISGAEAYGAQAYISFKVYNMGIILLK